MRLGARSWFAAALVASLAASAHAEPPAAKRSSAQERKRKQLLDELGLQKIDAPPPATVAPPPPVPPEAAADTEMAAERPASHPSTTPAAPPAPSFRRAVHPLLLQSCQVCHRFGGPAGATRMVLVGDAASDYAAVRTLVAPASPPASTLLVKASGQAHGGGAPWPADGEAHARVLSWIAKGARLDGGPTPATAVPTAVTSAEHKPAAPRPAVAAPSPAAPAMEAPASPPTDDMTSTTASTATPTPGSPPAPPTTGPSESTHALLMSACSPCHNPRGPAAASRFLLSGELAGDDVAARAMVDLTAPARSPLLTKATGELHGGGVVLGPSDPRAAALTAWVEGLAKPASAATAMPVPSPAGAQSAATSAPPPSAPSAPVAAPAPHGVHGGLPLAGGFMLNGRFDLAYERHDFSGNPIADGSTAALRSYHHFLFLSRESADDPFGLSVELTSLLFWEAHARLGGHGRPWRILLSGGKILVPFGADPLTHQSYGGLEGFDQRILPVIWAQEGVAAHLTLEHGRLVLTDDLFAVRGYALSHADSVLNLQADFSSSDDTKVGWGNRLGVAWLGASAWYSLYFNPLGFGRRLLMQAADLTIWRPRSVPVLGHFSAGAGLLRADVSGGGAGLDYYHFGSYFQLRYHPTDWLYLQYRQGLRTFNNRRGVIVDDTRLGPDDGSTHNFAVVARCHGLTMTLAYFLMFEKAGEIPNDFARASVAYDF